MRRIALISLKLSDNKLRDKSARSRDKVRRCINAGRYRTQNYRGRNNKEKNDKKNIYAENEKESAEIEEMNKK